MKVKGRKGFVPVEITITLESPEECRVMFELFDTVPIATFLDRRGIECDRIRDEIGDWQDWQDPDITKELIWAVVEWSRLNKLP